MHFIYIHKKYIPTYVELSCLLTNNLTRVE